MYNDKNSLREACRMPIGFHFRPEHNLVICTQVGEVGDEEFLASYTSLFNSDRFEPTMNLIVDLSRVDSSKRSRSILESFAVIAQKRLQGNNTKPMVAVIAPRDVSYGLARMYEALSHAVSWNFAVFRTAGEALSWLGLPQSFLDDIHGGS
jgi:hypothetical protein